jgi:two-component system sensor histidine kinase PilS (NtrC family)
VPEARRRLTYVMLFRVGVVTLLLVATFVSELAGPADQLGSARTNVLLALIGATYLFSILYSLWLSSIPSGGSLRTLGIAQTAIDLLLTTALLHLTGGNESGFAFMYLITVVSASFVVERSAVATSLVAVALFGLMMVLRGYGLLPSLERVQPIPLKELLRTVAVNGVAIVATGFLAGRLAIELKRAGERIETQGTRLANLATLHADVIRCLTSGLVTVDKRGVVITFNAAAAEILALPAERAVGRPIAELMPSLAPLLASVSNDSPLRRSEVAQGARVLGVSISPLVDAAGKSLGRIVSFQDLTELRRMEEEVARSEHLAAVGRLAAGVAHEIRNPLAAISGSIELLGRGGEAPTSDDQKQLMDIVLREVARLDALIRDLLEFARPRPPERQKLDLAANMGELKRVFENDRKLDFGQVELVAGDAIWVEADPGQLRQVVWNLLRNAAEAAPGAPITLSVGADRSDGKSWAWVAVTDRGPGIPPDQVAHIFEPFFTTKERGTGLGLATVHRIVEAHKGRIDVESPEGGGTRVCVRLPT